MFTLNGSPWTVQSTQQHATNILANMNSLLQAQSLSPIIATTGNILWFEILAAAQEIAERVDQPLSAAKNSFDIANCDDNQIYSLLSIAGTSLIPASYSSMNVTFTAASTGSLTVPSGSHVLISGMSNKFITQSTIVVPANQSLSVYTIADTTGPIIVVSGQVSGLLESYANFGSVVNTTACSVGSNIETAAQARARLLQGNVIQNNLNGLILALRSLPGVQGANAYFNYLLTASSLTTVSGLLSLPPRTAYMVIYGSSPNIASTYWNIMNAPTYGTQSQTVVTLSNQSFVINYDYAVPVNIYVQVFIQSSSIKNSSYVGALYTALANIPVSMGQLLTSEYMINQLSSYNFATIEGVLLSTNGTNYSVSVNIPVNGYAQFTSAYTSIVLQ
jgi:hypothetical protein